MSVFGTVLEDGGSPIEGGVERGFRARGELTAQGVGGTDAGAAIRDPLAGAEVVAAVGLGVRQVGGGGGLRVET